jgi:C4-dicarboxylate transporter
MWWIGAITAVWAAIRLWEGSNGLAWIAVVVAVVGIWTAGIGANFKTDRQAIPNAAAQLNIASAIAGIVMLVVSFVV